MQKVRFITPKPIHPEDGNSKDPRNFIPVEVEGWIENGVYDIAAVKDPRGLWYVYDIATGRFLNSNLYRTRKAAMESIPEWRSNLERFKVGNAEHYRELSDLNETLAHEFEVMRRASWNEGR